MSVNPDDIKAAMRLWASGVTIVTTANDTERIGTTASSFTSVALEPPLVLVCLFKEANATKQIVANQHFAVSILGEPHAGLSGQMAGFKDVPEGEDRFYGYEWFSQETGSPILTDASAWFDCKIHAVHESGTHSIIVGEVIATGRQEYDPDPLLYYNRGYRQIITPDESA
ncbi:MAG: flavin reductase family protein [Chloroflexota bacterium]